MVDVEGTSTFVRAQEGSATFSCSSVHTQQLQCCVLSATQTRALHRVRALAAVACNPMELVKVRLQSKGDVNRGVASVLREVTASHGLQGLWKGTVPSAVRSGPAISPSRCTPIF